MQAETLRPAGVVLGSVAATLLLAWWYFRHYQTSRPPIGVLNGWDVLVMLAAAVLVPWLYLALPRWVVAAVLAVVCGNILAAAAEPIVRVRWARWLAIVALVAADVGTTVGLGPASRPFLLVNNIVICCTATGTANLWAQGGLKARDLVVLAIGLSLYDFLATAQLPVTADLFAHLAGLPFIPLVSWTAGGAGASIAIGLGDLLVASTFPLTMRRAFGRSAGLMAMAVTLSILAVLLAFLNASRGLHVIPTMVILGPVMVLQYAGWRWRGPERTTRRYLEVEPVR